MPYFIIKMPSESKKLLSRHSHWLIVDPCIETDQPVNVSVPNVMSPRVLSLQVELANTEGHGHPPSENM